MKRFWDKVAIPPDGEGCWLWTGATNDFGYGWFGDEGRAVKAHRFAYELLVGPIGDEDETRGGYRVTLDHLCRNPSCVRPDHLEVTTNTENVLRGDGPTAVNARKTECIRGHALTGSNVAISAEGWRRCCECRRMRDRERYRSAAR